MRASRGKLVNIGENRIHAQSFAFCSTLANKPCTLGGICLLAFIINASFFRAIDGEADDDEVNALRVHTDTGIYTHSTYYECATIPNAV